VVDGQRVLAIGERRETAPGVDGESADERIVLVGRRAGPPYLRPTREALGHVRPRGHLTPEAVFPGALARGDDGIARLGFAMAADDVSAELARLVRGWARPCACGESRGDQDHEHAPHRVRRPCQMDARR